MSKAKIKLLYTGDFSEFDNPVSELEAKAIEVFKRNRVGVLPKHIYEHIKSQDKDNAYPWEPYTEERHKELNG